MRLHRIIFALPVYAILLAAAPAWADSADRYPALRESFDPELQSRLERTLRGLGLQSAIDQGKLGVVLADITDLEDPRLASVNGDEMFYAASLPKLAILLGAFVEIERGAMTLDRATRESLVQMIRYSSNVEATRMLRRVGISVEDWLAAG